MFAQLTGAVDFHGKALALRAERQRLIASNIANADTPNYVARDLDFKQAMTDAVGAETAASASVPRLAAQGTATHPRHIPVASQTGELGGAAGHMSYVARSQPSMDANTVDLDQERSNFIDNAVRYESTLRFINGHSKTILSAITGQ